MSEVPWKPNKQQLADAAYKVVPDVIEPGLQVVFCGINPGLYTAAIGHHFGRPGNRFWKVIHLAGFTPHELSPFEDTSLPEFGLGVTNVVMRTTATAAELSKDEIRASGKALRSKVSKYAPQALCILGVQAYRVAFNSPKADIGEQQPFGNTRVWVLPNPSGLQAHYQLADMVQLASDMRKSLR